MIINKKHVSSLILLVWSVSVLAMEKKYFDKKREKSTEILKNLARKSSRRFHITSSSSLLLPKKVRVTHKNQYSVWGLVNPINITVEKIINGRKKKFTLTYL